MSNSVLDLPRRSVRLASNIVLLTGRRKSKEFGPGDARRACNCAVVF